MSGVAHYCENIPPSPPPAPPLPPQRYGNRAASALARFAQPFIYSSRPPSANGDRSPSSRELGIRLTAERSSSPTSRTTAHKTGLPINAFDISPTRTHAILAGREILKTVHVTDSACTEDFNLRSSILAYVAAHNNSGATISAKHKDQLAATDVKWSHGNYDTTVATAATSGQIVIYDINRAGVELARLHEHSRQVHRIAFNPFQGALMLSGSQDSTIRLWDLRTLERDGSVLTCRSTHKYPGNSEGIRDLRWSPTEGMEFAVGTDNGVVQRWDFQRPNVPLLKINAHEKTCYSIDWHPDGKHLASGGADKNVKVWDFSSTDRRMKPCWQLRTPKAVHNLRWRPPHWTAEEGAPGRWDSTQLAASYDNQDPRTHIWDLRRPSVPAREINRYNTAPTALLWHSESLLWSVGIAGMFTQTDINFARKVSDKQTSNTIATAPDGSLALFLDERFKGKGHAAELGYRFDRRHKRAGSTGEKLSTSYSAAEGSFEEPSLLSSSFRSRRRKVPSTRSSRSLASTPPSAGNGGPILYLNEALHQEYLYRPAQAAACGRVRGIFEADAFIFLAYQYQTRIPLSSGPKKTILESISETMIHNAASAAYVAQHRLAQSWRILALALQQELSTRANRNRTLRSQSLKRLSTNMEGAQSNSKSDSMNMNVIGDCHIFNESQSEPPNILRKLPTTVSLDGGSNMTTPLARPVSNATFEATPSSGRGALDGYDSLELPEPRFRKRSPQKPAETTSALSRLRSPTDSVDHTVEDQDTNTNNSLDETNIDVSSPQLQAGFHAIDRHMNERRAAMQNYRTTPRPVLRLEDSIQTMETNPLVPRFERHDSNESFQMFSASTDSSNRARSLIGSFESSQGSGSSGPVPERWDVARRAGNDIQDPRRPGESRDSSPSRLKAPKEDHQTSASFSAYNRSLERPTSTTRILHEDTTTNPDEALHVGRGKTNDEEQDGFIESDFQPSTDDPPPAFWTATGMFRPLIDFHLNQLSDVQFPAILLLLLQSYVENNIPGVLVSSIFLDYHRQLVSLSLYPQAASLRKFASVRSADIAEYGTYGVDTGGPWCTKCNKPSKGDKAGFCSRCRQYWAKCPVCDGDDPVQVIRTGSTIVGADMKEKERQPSPYTWGWCQDCGHGGHVGCLHLWWDDADASEGGCPTLGCLHDCVAGTRRNALLQRAANIKKTSAVKGDTWVVKESQAVEKTRGLMGTVGNENMVLQDRKGTRSSTPAWDPLGMAAMGRTSSGGKKVRLLVPDMETTAYKPEEFKEEDRTSASAPS
ncbi:MAG: hypothetical protein Q9186_003691 [Xanthomendoza sp. 1 TL-2023]